MLSFFLVNCTIQKRTFNKGYFVQWNFKQKVNSQNQNQPKLEEEQSQLDEANTDLSIESENLPDEFIKDSKNEKLELNDDITIEKKDFIKNFENKATKLIFSKTPILTKIKIAKVKKGNFAKLERSKMIRTTITLLVGLCLLGIGVVFLANSFASTHIVGGSFLAGLTFSFVGAIFIVFSLFRFICIVLKTHLTKQTNEADELQKRFKRISSRSALLSLLFLFFALIVSLISQTSILFPILLIIGFAFLIFSALFSFTD